MIALPVGPSEARRDALQAFYTPAPLADFCVDVLTRPTLVGTWLGRAATVCEPSAGRGDFVTALLKRTPHVHAIDIDPTAAGLALAPTSEVADFLSWEPQREYDWFVGNVPYGATSVNHGDAEAHIRRALSFARVGAAFLLRQGFVATKKRAAFWREHPAAHREDLLERPSFTEGGTDQYDYAFIVWLRKHRSPIGTWRVSSWKNHRVAG